MTDPVATLSELLHQCGVKYRVFDIGRRIVRLRPDEFVFFERAKSPYPYPYMKKAYFGLVFWNPKHNKHHHVWFLCFPLDEQGLLVQAARDEFLVTLLARVGQAMLTEKDIHRFEHALKDNPYTVKPREDKMAAFNAQVTKTLALKPSSFYPAARAYFTGKMPLEEWPSLGMQGVADFAVRLDDVEETMGLITRLSVLPDQPFMMLATFLENAQPSATIVEILSQMLTIELQETKPDIVKICACLRAASNSPASGLVELMVKHVLQHDCSRDVEVLATISGRIWQVIKTDYLCDLFLQKLAENTLGQGAFSQLLADLMFMPGLRPHIMKGLRSPQRTEALDKAIGIMFGNHKKAD